MEAVFELAVTYIKVYFLIGLVFSTVIAPIHGMVSKGVVFNQISVYEGAQQHVFFFYLQFIFAWPNYVVSLFVRLVKGAQKA
ncbi:MAG TPA: hypothetical protein VFD12_00040 [Oligella sp.]|nr:hypothetical protein [Oligella sp.]